MHDSKKIVYIHGILLRPQLVLEDKSPYFVSLQGGWNPLMVASMNGHVDVVSALVAHVDINFRTQVILTVSIEVLHILPYK